jgi:hypothetical protein
LIWQKKLKYILPVIIVSFILLNFVSGASERFYKTFRFSNVIVDLSTGQPIGTLDSIEGTTAVIEKEKTPDVESLPKGSGFIGVPTENKAKVKTVEVLVSRELATGSGEIATISGSFLIQKAFVYDISITTRFQGQWPKAIEAFKRNIFLGSGFSTLSLAADGDYMRMLGETGILGTIAFLGIFLLSYAIFFKYSKNLQNEQKSFVIGVFAGLTGLFVNAVLIDVFEASKVAFSLWILLGAAIGVLTFKKEIKISYFNFLWKVLTSKLAFALYLFIITFIIYGSSINNYFVADDFTWLKWAAESKLSDVFRYFINANGFFYRPVPKILYFVEYTLFWLKAGMYHFVSIFIFAMTALSVYFILIKIKVRPILSLILTLLFICLAVHHENVFWISGQSSLLGGLFLFTAIALFITYWNSRSNWLKYLYWLTGLSLLFLAMVSYDGLIIIPLIIFILGIANKQIKRPENYIILGLIPVYWFLRVRSQAVIPTGDYGYNLSKLGINSVANLLGYTGSIVLGPIFSGYMQYLRLELKQYISQITILVTFSILGISFLIFKIRKNLINNIDIFLWLITVVISLGAYLGLGGLADRYALFASGLIIITLGLVINKLLSVNNSNLLKVLTAVILIITIYWNYKELSRFGNDWNEGSKLVETTLLRFKKTYFPQTGPKTFIFVKVPAKYGQSWFFPTGLGDAIWHMFKFSNIPYAVVNVNSEEEAFKYQGKIPSYEILIFDKYKLKSLSKETVVVSEEKK